MILREIFAKLGLQVDHHQFEKAEHSIEKLAGGFAALGVGAELVHKYWEGLEESIKRGAAFGDLSAKTGIAVDTLQGLQHAAEQSGTTLEAAATGLKFLAKNAYEASQGSTELQTAFRQAGLSIKDASGRLKPADVLMAEFGDKLREMPDHAKRTALAMTLMGRSGAELLPMLAGSEETLTELIEDSKYLGQLSEEEVHQRKRAEDQINRLNRAWTALKDKARTPMIKLIERGAHALTDFVVWLRRTYEGSERVKAAVSALGVFMAAFAGAMIVAGAAMLGPLLAPLIPLALIAAKLAFLALIVEDLWLFFTDPTASTMTGRLVDGFKDLWKSITEDPKQFFIDLFDWIVSMFGLTGERIRQKVIDSITGAISAAKGAIGAVANPVNGTMQEIFGSAAKLGGPISSAFSMAGGPLMSGFYPPGSVGGATTNNVSINVHPAPGQSSHEIAADVLSQAKAAVGK